MKDNGGVMLCSTTAAAGAHPQAQAATPPWGHAPPPRGSTNVTAGHGHRGCCAESRALPFQVEVGKGVGRRPRPQSTASAHAVCPLFALARVVSPPGAHRPGVGAAAGAVACRRAGPPPSSPAPPPPAPRPLGVAPPRPHAAAGWRPSRRAAALCGGVCRAGGRPAHASGAGAAHRERLPSRCGDGRAVVDEPARQPAGAYWGGLTAPAGTGEGVGVGHARPRPRGSSGVMNDDVVRRAAECRALPTSKGGGGRPRMAGVGADSRREEEQKTMKFRSAPPSRRRPRRRRSTRARKGSADARGTAAEGRPAPQTG